VEITWFGGTCVRLRGRDAVVVSDAYPAIVGPTGRGITADIATFSHPDDAPPAKAKAKGRRTRDGGTVVPASLDPAFVLDGPGEYEIGGVLLTGVRTYRDDDRGGKRGKGTAFVIELDGLHTIHLGDIGHLLTEEKLGDIGSVDIACVPVGGALTATKAAELVAQLDPKIVVAMPVCERDADCTEALARFFHEMGGEPTPQPKLSVSISTLPDEVTAVVLESRGKT
jgi:L-ascorbate metabolism protein UlaG (beta-lactamase superfamily)